MIRYLFLSFLLGFVIPVTAQKIHFPVKVNNQWTFLEVTDASNRLDETRRYDYLGDLNLPWFDRPGTQSGYYLVELAEKLGLVTAAFEPVIRPAWREVHPISDQYFLVADELSYAIIDRNGKPVLRGDHFQAIKLPPGSDLSFFMIMQAGKWGVKKRGQNNWSIPPEYTELAFLEVGTDGLFKVKKGKNTDSKWQLINWKGSEVPGFTGAFDQVEAASQNHIAVQETSRKTSWSIRDLSGKELLILGPETQIHPLNKSLFSYKEKGSNTYSVLVMQKVITPLVEQFPYLQPVNEELVFYRLGDKSGFIPANGRLMPMAAEQILDVHANGGDLLRVKGTKANQWGLYSIKEQRIILDCQFDSIDPFIGPFAMITREGKMGLINDAGTLIAPPRYEAIPHLAVGMDRIYCYWKDSVQVYPVDPDGRLNGDPYADESSAVLGPERYYWTNEDRKEVASAAVTTPGSLFPAIEKKAALEPEWMPEGPSDTLWIEKDKSYWKMEGDRYQLMQWEEVEVVVRDKATAAAKKKKSKKRKKPAPPAPKKTELVMKWVAKGAPYQSLRKASSVDWTLAYHGDDGLVANELTKNGKTRFSVRKIHILRNENNTLIPDLEITGIRLSDFADGLPYAAFCDLDGKIGLIDKAGEQAADAAGEPLRFTYISSPAEGKMQVCHPASAFSQVGLSLAQLFQEFNAELVNGPGTYTSQLQSDKQALWGYLNPQGELVIPFEYEWAAPFQDEVAINKKNGKWGVIAGDNQTIIPFEYDAVTLGKDHWKVIKENRPEVSAYYDEEGNRYETEEKAGLAMHGQQLLRIQLSDSLAQYGYADRAGQILIPPQFDYASEFYDGLATVRKGRKWFFIDETGKDVIHLDTSIIGIIEVGNFSEGLCPIRKTTILDKKPTRKYGYLNAQGKLAIPPVFDGAGLFQDGLAVVDSLNLSGYRPGQEGGIPRDLALIDQQGNLVTEYAFRRISGFNEAGFAEVVAAKTGKQGVIDKAGKVLTGNYYARVKTFKDGMATFDGTFWQVFDYTGKAISLPVAEITSISYFADKDLIVKDKSDTWYHLAIVDGQAVLQQGGFQLLQPFEHGYALARKDGQMVLYGRDQSWIRPAEGQLFKSWSNGLIGVKSKGHEFFANLGLQNVYHRTFDAIDDFGGQAAQVNYRGKAGAINRNGMFIIPPKFDLVSREKAGPIQVQVSGRLYGLRSKDGQEIVPARYDSIQHLRNGIIRVGKADFVGYYRPDGEVLWGREHH